MTSLIPWTSERLRTPAAAALACLLWAEPAAAAEGGLVLIPDVRVMLPLMVLFVVLVPVLNRLLFRPLLQVLEQREERIEGARRRAEQLRVDADAVLRRYEQAVNEVREEAERSRRERIDATRVEQLRLRDEAREAAEQQIEAGRQQLEGERNEAQSGLRSAAEALAREAADRILGRALS
ncbi:MAG: ATP synthase F0 subunit B [Proteobacteria bacterium]|nr:ATP synthase F0 subunit B [Pseudomonadota bacterium]